jgi:hypothetical protein
MPRFARSIANWRTGVKPQVRGGPALWTLAAIANLILVSHFDADRLGRSVAAEALLARISESLTAENPLVA